MILCPKCNAELSDDAKFCAACGAKIGEGTNLENAVGNAVPDMVKAPEHVDLEQAEVRKKSKKGIVIGGILVAVILVAIVAIRGTILEGGTQETQDRYALYLKDNEIYITDFEEKNKSTQVTSRLWEESVAGASEYSFAFASSCHISDAAGIVFYPDKLDSISSDFNLYYKKLDDLDGEATKIDSNVVTYSVNNQGNVVTYLKEDTLCQYYLKDETKEKVRSDIRYYKVSDDGKIILCLSTDGAIYVQVEGQDAEKMVGDISSLEYVSEDLSTVWYVRDEALYRQKVGFDREKIAEDVLEVVHIYDSGECYYLTSGDEITVADFMADELWDLFEDTDDVAFFLNELWYNDGEEEVLLSENLVDMNYECASKVPTILYVTLDATDFRVVTYDDYYRLGFDGVYDMMQDSYEHIKEYSSFYVADGDAISELEELPLDQMEEVGLGDDGTYMYYFVDGSLYIVPIENGASNEPVLYDEDVVYVDSSSSLENMLYYKDDSYDMYLNKTCVDYDIYTLCVERTSGGNVFYLMDYSHEKYTGTLKMYDGKEKITIAEDVSTEYRALSDDKVLYLSDYNASKNRGELYLWEDGEKEKIAEDVNGFISTLDWEYNYVWSSSSRLPIAIDNNWESGSASYSGYNSGYN